jgi:uncharacterized membrane protein YhdT
MILAVGPLDRWIDYSCICIQMTHPIVHLFVVYLMMLSISSYIVLNDNEQ